MCNILNSKHQLTIFFLNASILAMHTKWLFSPHIIFLLLFFHSSYQFRLISLCAYVLIVALILIHLVGCFVFDWLFFCVLLLRKVLRSIPFSYASCISLSGCGYHIMKRLTIPQSPPPPRRRPRPLQYKHEHTYQRYQNDYLAFHLIVRFYAVLWFVTLPIKML